MAKSKESFFRVSKEEFDNKIRPKLEEDLRQTAGNDVGPPGQPAGGLSNGLDSLTAVVVVEGVIPKHLGEAPPAEKIIREGGYDTIDEFIADLLPKLRALCPDVATLSEGAENDERHEAAQ